jgi:hypothetical protein
VIAHVRLLVRILLLQVGRLRQPEGFCYRQEAGASDPPYGKMLSDQELPKNGSPLG